MALDPTILMMMKMRKRHVRIALQRQRAEEEAVASVPCPNCHAPTTPQYEEGVYKGNFCPNGHDVYLTKRKRNPNAPRAAVERADVRGLPSQGHAPPPISATEVQRALERQKQFQGTVEDKFKTPNWKNDEIYAKV